MLTSKSGIAFLSSCYYQYVYVDIYNRVINPVLSLYCKIFKLLSVAILDHADTYAPACKSPEVGIALAGIQGLFSPRRGFCSAKIPGTFSQHKRSAGLSTV